MTQRWITRRTLGTTVFVGIALVGGSWSCSSGFLVRSDAQGPALARGNAHGEWRYWGADQWSSRYSPLDQINARNFDSLAVAWVWPAGSFGADEYYRTTPLY
ncbi:MAG: hypothetical protein WEE89_06170, partial [Gemmatimonadota bacterium]